METGKKWFDEAHHRQAKKSFVTILLILLISGICGKAEAATPTEIEQAIEDGVAWLAAQQNSSTGYWQDGGYMGGPTGLALIKLEERAFELEYTPFDPCYPYKENVENGLAYLFSQMSIISTPNQPAGDPNTDGDGIGVYVSTGAITYETGIAMMAIAASRAPDREVNSPGSPVHGWTYKQVLTDMVDYMAFGQVDSGSGRGGWGYSHNEGWADNSNSGYAVSGLGYAESPRYGFLCSIPQFVKDELKIWIDYIQIDGGDDDGGSGYTSPSSANILRTGNLVFQMTFAEITPEDPNFQRALAYIGRKWSSGWSGDCQAMYCTANGLWYSDINTIVVDGNERDWYADFADNLVNTQQSNGYWYSSYGNVLGTEWALLALEIPSGPWPTPRPELTKVDDVNEGGCVGWGDETNYRIDYNYPAGPNRPDINNVSIIDYLPDEVDFVSILADFNGDGFVDFDDLAILASAWLSKKDEESWNQICNIFEPVDNIINFLDFAVFADNWLSAYDPGPRTFTWYIGTLHPGDAGFVMLKVRVKPCVEPNGTITNECEIKSGDMLLDRAYEHTPVCCPTLTKVDVNDGNCVGPSDYITYNICYDANGYGDTNVVIVDDLPPELEFISATGNYEHISGTVTWDIGTLGPNDSNCVTLTAKVLCSQPSGTITNCCDMMGDCITTAITACEHTQVCGPPTLTKIDNIPDGNCVGPSDYITYNICYDANGYGDTNVVIVDDLPPELEFISATGNYEHISGTVTWDIGTLGPNDSNCVTLTAKVLCHQPSRTITNCCEMTGDCMTNAVSACENTAVCCCPTLTKVDNITGCVGPGENITYDICYAANGYSDSNVVIDDNLPNEVDFVSASNDGVYNPGSHAVTWNIAFPSDACGCVNLVVKVNMIAASGGRIINHCEMAGDCMTSAVTVYEDTNVCCWMDIPVVYVDADANGNNNGTSWADAYKYLQDALLAARNCDYNEIRLAEGTYKPDRSSLHPNGTGDREATFELINGVEIKGGYAGFGEPDPNVRGIKQYETILSGDLEGNDSEVVDPWELYNDPCRAENSYHVVTGSDTNNSAVIDGFTITGGYSPNNYNGGGMYNDGGSPKVTNCTFSENFAFYGGGMYNDSYSSPKVRNCIFKGNFADWSGGGMFNNGSSTVTNCIFIGNIAFGNGGIYNSGSQVVTNCIIRGNDYGQISDGNVTYSDIQGGHEGEGNIDADPMFKPDGYHLTLCSPCIDAGDPNYVAEPNETDIDGEPRIMGCADEPRVDMGVDEYYPEDCNVFLRAHCPSPACGETDVPRDVVICWKPGVKADKHCIYFGTDFNDVNDANDPNKPPGRGCQDANCYDPCTGLLEPNQCYYWRIDEVNGSNIWRGDVWHFRTVLDCYVVEDFDSYEDTIALRQVWKDYWSQEAPKTSAEVSLEYTIVIDGNSMRYDYKNYEFPPYYSEARAYINDLPSGISSNWLGMGAIALSLRFYGEATNPNRVPNDDMYLTVIDSNSGSAKVYYTDYGDINDLRIEEWQEWNIPLTDFNGVDLTGVARIIIGFGNEDDQAANDGVVYFEDIQLCK